MDTTGVGFYWACGHSLDPTEFFRDLAVALGRPDSNFSDSFGVGAREIELSSLSVEEFRDKYLLAEILTKWSSALPGFEHIDRVSVAKQRFFEGEQLCSETNKRLFSKDSPSQFISRVECIARRVICSILGDFLPSEFLTSCTFGPGASTRLGRREAHLPKKFSGRPHVTPGATEIAFLVVNESPLWVSALDSREVYFQLHPGAKFVTVPKNYKTDRSIAIEPDMNLFLQKGVGNMIRSRMQNLYVFPKISGRTERLDLNSQELNRNLAREGSLDGSFATVDLSMASDTISLGAVFRLLPETWFEVMDRLRSPCILIDGRWVTLEKFSSMGNGFTWELESLIFYGLCYAVREIMNDAGPIAVYGDDLVVSANVIGPLSDALSYFGFVLNEKKTHYSGSFRESCGKHFFRGHDVTPFYLRKCSDVHDIMLLHNNLVRWGLRHGYRDVRLRSLTNKLRNSVPKAFRRLAVPLGYGDGGFLSSFPPTGSRCKKGHDGWRVRQMLPVTRNGAHKYDESPGTLPALLHLMERRNGPCNKTAEGSLFDDYVGMRQRWSFFSEWPDLGPYY